MGVCVTKCSKKQPVFKTIINDSFSILVLRNNSQSGYHDPKVKRIQTLQAHVKNHTKTLIDHIESNREKLVETIIYIKKTIYTNNNIEYHLVGVFILMEIVNNLNKFKIKSLKKDNENEEGGNNTLRIRDDSISLDVNDEPIIKIDDNLAHFEREFFDLMIYFFESKYKYRDIMFNYSLTVLLVYSQISNERISTDKSVQLLKKLINDENIRNKLMDKKINKNDYKIIIDMMTTLFHLTVRSSHNTTMEILQDYLITTMHIFACLNKIDFEEIDIINKNETKNFSLKSLLFDTLDHLSEAAFQINEFGMIINPLFEFFDGVAWTYEEIHIEIFMKIIENSRKSKNLEHFEIFLIEKIIDYLTLNEKNKNNIHINSFHNTDQIEIKPNSHLASKNYGQKKEIKLKVYKLLKKVINHISYIYLSFLYIDKLICFFCQTIEDTNLNDIANESLKTIVYKTFKKFLFKIHPFIKNIFQMLNCLSSEIYKRISLSNPSQNVIKEIFNLFYMTLEQLEKFPVYSSIPEDLVKNLLKGGEKYEFLVDSYKALNLIFNAKFSNNEVLQVTDHYSPHLNLEVNNMNESENNNNCDTLLNLPFNIFIMILVDMWKRIKEYKNNFNAKSAILKEDINQFLLFYNSMRSIIFSMHLRNDSSFSPGLNSFFIKLISIYNEERNGSFNGILFFIIYDQIFIYAKITNDEALFKYLVYIKEKINQESVKKLCEYIETISENSSLNVTDLNSISEKITKISIKLFEDFIFSDESMTNIFKDMIISQDNDNNNNNHSEKQEIPSFEDFIKLNEHSNKEKFIKDILTFNNEFQDLIPDHEARLGHKNSSIILHPKSFYTTTAELQVNANYENALQIVKSNNMRRKKLEALIEIDNKI